MNLQSLPSFYTNLKLTNIITKQLVLRMQLNKGRLEMKTKKSMNIMACLLIIASFLILNVYAADASGTYTDSLIDGNNPIDVYLEGEYMGEYTDYRGYQVNLDKNQNIEVKLEVPNGADFDLFVYTEDEMQGWSSTLDTFGADEELNITIPETGAYKFLVASWEGSGSFTLRWETPGAESIPTYLLIGIIVVIVAIIVIILLMRRRSRVPAPPPPVYAPPSAPTPAPSEAPQMVCPHCNGPLNWIEQYQRWYCHKCSKYI